jgi:hypothetical protein
MKKFAVGPLNLGKLYIIISYKCKRLLLSSFPAASPVIENGPVSSLSGL